MAPFAPRCRPPNRIRSNMCCGAESNDYSQQLSSGPTVPLVLSRPRKSRLFAMSDPLHEMRELAESD